MSRVEYETCGMKGAREACVLTALCGMLALVTTGCMALRPGWTHETDTTAGVATSEERQTARELWAQADSTESLGAAIEAYETILPRAPRDLDVLCKLSQCYCLQGAAYAESMAHKKRAYKKAIQLAERALATDPTFLERVQAGASVGEASTVLSEEHMEAMMLWVNGVSYYFKECQSPLQRMVNFRWMARCQQVVDHMESLDPNWGQGAVLFTKAVFFLGLPEFAGGDMIKSAQYFQRAIAAGPRSTLHRWGRAKYYATKIGDREMFISDLQWVLDQPLRASEDPPYPWRVVFHREARSMLEHVDRYF